MVAGVDTNIVGTLLLIKKIRRIRATAIAAASASQGFQAVYNGTKAFIDSFSCALRNELKETDVTVTWLMPGATATRFFERAGMLDTKSRTGSEGRSSRRCARRLQRHDQRRRR
jgi:short-subunit dehydrogenase